jgi:RNA polymerase sigma factor (sigma-70 family)
MVEKTHGRHGGADLNVPQAISVAAQADAWFAHEVLPLEAALMQFLQHNWRNKSDIYDLRQEIYVRVYEAALKQIPERPKQFVFATARHLLIDRVRQEQIIPIEAAADLEALDIVAETPGPDRVAMARDELRRLQAALDRLPTRAREAVVLGRIEGLSRHQIAVRMGIAEGTVAQYLSRGICMLVDILYGEPPNVRRQD